MVDKANNKVVVLGSANLDIFIKVERAPQVGETISSNHLEKAIGGKGCNTAIALGKLGFNVEFLGQVGNDDAKNAILDCLKQSNVQFENVQVLSHNVTGQAYILSYPDGNNSIVIIGGANTDWDKDKETRLNKLKEVIEKADFLLLQREIPEEINVFASKIASTKGIPVLLDVGGQDTVLSEDLLANVSILSPNETELSRIIKTHIDITSENSIIDACEALRKQAKNTNLEFLLKLGSKGAKYITKSNEVISQNSLHITSMPIIDTTGAGDCFTGSFAGHYLSNGLKDIKSSLEFATACAYKSITRFGAGPSMPTLEEANEVIKLSKA
jgi:ribokinase